MAKPRQQGIAKTPDREPDTYITLTDYHITVQYDLLRTLKLKVELTSQTSPGPLLMLILHRHDVLYR